MILCYLWQPSGITQSLKMEECGGRESQSDVMWEGLNLLLLSLRVEDGDHQSRKMGSH